MKDNARTVLYWFGHFILSAVICWYQDSFFVPNFLIMEERSIAAGEKFLMSLEPTAVSATPPASAAAMVGIGLFLTMFCGSAACIAALNFAFASLSAISSLFN